MRKNKVKAALKRGEVVYGSCVMYERNPAIAEIYASCGLDFIYVDMEHSSISMSSVADMIWAAKAADIVPLVGPSTTRDVLLTRPMDAGAMGLVVPHVDTRAEVEAIVSSVKYPPVGQRGFNGHAPHTDFEHEVPGDEVIRHINAESMIVLKIESATAIDDLEDLLSIGNVDACMVGPGDLSVSLGIPGRSHDPKEEAYIQKLIDTCRRMGVASGIHASDPEWIKQWIARGMQFIAYSSDSGLIERALAPALKDFRAQAAAGR